MCVIRAVASESRNPKGASTSAMSSRRASTSAWFPCMSTIVIDCGAPASWPWVKGSRPRGQNAPPAPLAPLDSGGSDWRARKRPLLRPRSVCTIEHREPLVDIARQGCGVDREFFRAIQRPRSLRRSRESRRARRLRRQAGRQSCQQNLRQLRPAAQQSARHPSRMTGRGLVSRPFSPVKAPTAEPPALCSAHPSRGLPPL